MYSKEAVEYYYEHAPRDEWYGAVQYLETIDEFYERMSYKEMLEADRGVEALSEIVHCLPAEDIPF